MSIQKLVFSFIFLILANYGSLEFIPVFRTKVVLNIDLSSVLPEQVTVETIDGSNTLHYSIDPIFDEHYKIGEIRNYGVLISEDSPMAIRRRVSLVANIFGIIYVQVDNVYCSPYGIFEKHIEELVKEPDDNAYKAVNRTPITLDIEKLPYKHPFINEKVESSGGTRYATHALLRPYVSIGLIKYGEYVIDDRVDDVMNKAVVVGMNPMGKKMIIITTLAKDATYSTLVYEVVQQENGLPFTLRSYNSVEIF
ncbi:signal peptide containing protein [Theileria equi strain WA]|uniref:Signal peptide containing protein n=1 Tax=Theileria equi strain WA TaxID=1537102 RepID=L1LCA7_THEEQ|nr:signal peptide containing protein [Theileria equi strain WA]EKX73082.1 signal peptide containing protein [Theileria equi strain WA]|eukprot:XP_004832534.1 signal peptide containing protein [Theileria equi strain WA]